MKRVSYVIAVIMLILCLFSCTDEIGTSKGTLRIDVNRTTRTISPESANVKITRYALIGTHVETDTPIDHSFTGNTLTISDMKVGEWSLRVAGYNAAGNEIATSIVQTVSIVNSKETAAHFVVAYDKSKNGTFSVSVDVPEIATTVKGIKIELTGLNGSSSEVFQMTAADSSVSDGRRKYSKSFSLTPGRWDVVFSVVDADGRLIGKPYYESLHVYAEETSSIVLPWSSGMFLKTQAPIFSLVPDEVYLEGTELAMYSEPGAIIHYTFDGQNPLMGGPIYSGPCRLLKTSTYKAYAIRDGLIRSEIVEGLFKVKPHAPTVDNSTEVHSTPFDVTLKTKTDFAEIRYTLDGSDPTKENGLLYSKAIHIETPLTLKARAYKNELEPSDLLVVTYTFDKQTGNFEIEGPDEYALVITDAKGHSLPTYDPHSVKATLTPNVPGARYEWYLDGEKVPGLTADTVSVGDTTEDIIVAGRNSAILTVKVSWEGYSLTENIVLIYLGVR